MHIDRTLVEHSINEYLEELKQELASDQALPNINVQSRDKYLVFDLLLDHRYPFYQPQIFCRTAFCNPPTNDGRDVFNEVVREEWRVNRKLYEIIMYIPEFVADVAIEEQENGGMLLKVVGTFHLGNSYEMSNWGVNGVNRDSRIFSVQE